MNDFFIIGAYLLIGLLVVWYSERRSKSISEIGGYKTAAFIVLIWPLLVGIHILMKWVPPATDICLRILKYVRLPFIQLFCNKRPPTDGGN